MTVRRRVAVALSAAAGLAGCAPKPEVAARTAYEAGVARGATRLKVGKVRAGEDAADLTAVGWKRVAAILARGRPALASGQPARVEALVARWCAVAPTPQATEAGPVYVCVPEPPLRVEGRRFTLEIGAAGGGLVSVVSPTLAGDEAARIADSARALARRTCAGALEQVEAIDDPTARIVRCALGDGTILVVAQVPRDLRQDLWQVSIALLGAT